jgi:hypothetical protein
LGYAGHVEVDDLYALPPSEFTAARDALAKELKSPEVKKLRRPTVGAWAVNQVVREQPEVVDALVESGQMIRDALGSGDRETLRAATRARRDAVAVATKAAVKLAGESHRDAIAATFDAAAVDDDAAEVVRAGRLAKELPAPAGFGLDDMPDLPAPKRPPKPDKQAERRAEAERAADGAEAHARELRRAADEAIAAAEKAERAAGRARKKGDELADD